MTALLPFLIGTIDLFAHCRRRRIPLAPAARSLRGRLYFWGYAGVLVFVAALLGAFPKGEARPLPPDPSLYTPSPIVLGILGVLLFVGWLVARERLLPRRPARPEETLAGHTVALLGLGLIALLVVATNPFSLVYLLPSLYAWLRLPQAHASGQLARERSSWSASPAAAALSFSTRLGLGFGDALVPALPRLRRLRTPIAVALAFAWLAVAAQLTTLAVGRYAPYPSTRTRRPRRPLRLLDGRQSDSEREAIS